MAPRWQSDQIPSNGSITDLPITNDHCMNTSCRAFAAGFNASEELIPLLSQLEYAKWAIYHYAFWIILFTLIYAGRLIRDQLITPRKALKPEFRASATPSAYHKFIALCRWFTYRRYSGRGALKLQLPSFGICFILGLATIFFSILPFVEHPYLRERFRFGSPPISVRCAMTISALTPLTIALAGKVNIISMMTGICYSKLNVFHRFVAYVVFALSTVHTIPHLVAPVKDGGWDMLNMLYYNQRRELSGTPLYAVMFGLCFFSIPWARHRVYELFAYTHILLAIAYLGILYWHIKGEYMSPNYLWTTVAVWGFTTVLRIFHRNRILRPSRSCSLASYPTVLQHLPGRMTRVVVTVTSNITWRPGEHMFIRMPKISILDNHPFTIASIPSKPSSSTPRELVFLIRSHKGFTHSLAARVEDSSTSPPLSPVPSQTRVTPAVPLGTLEAQRRKTPDLRTWLDGPYGGYARPLHRIYDTVICVAGGSGVTASLPWLLYLVGKMRDEACITRTVRLIWMVRRVEWMDWVKEEFEAVMRLANWDGVKGKVVLDVYVTRVQGSGSLTTSEESVASARLGVPSLVVLQAKTVEKERKQGVKVLQGEIAGSTCNSSESVQPLHTSRDQGSIHEGGPENGKEAQQNAKLNVLFERPNLASLLPLLVEGARTKILGCGPECMKIDLSNAAARLQQKVFAGECKEIALHTETFGW